MLEGGGLGAFAGMQNLEALSQSIINSPHDIISCYILTVKVRL